MSKRVKVWMSVEDASKYVVLVEDMVIAGDRKRHAPFIEVADLAMLGSEASELRKQSRIDDLEAMLRKLCDVAQSGAPFTTEAARKLLAAK